ncbi:TolB family protein [Marinifilum sp. D737]|uniref:TolB family protein n=1 Tax=Marinifilum sp. D737 TaxID=2969628 RepID=UPI00227390FC|nr:hypothetical protein [Marinifilum sp. D737]MCY1635220.1 hypothetical protein [Marinifilum sp. D737]
MRDSIAFLFRKPHERTRAVAGASDLYISFNVNDKWSEPKNLGSLINTDANEYGPFFSPDNKYLFFVRHDGKKGDIYWVDLNVINALKPKA